MAQHSFLFNIVQIFPESRLRNCGFVDRRNKILKVDDDKDDLYGCRFPSLMAPIPNHHKILKQTKGKGMLPKRLIRFGGRAIKFGDDFFKCWPAGGRSKVRSYDESSCLSLLTINYYSTSSKACSLHIWNRRFLHSSTYNK